MATTPTPTYRPVMVGRGSAVHASIDGHHPYCGAVRIGRSGNHRPAYGEVTCERCLESIARQGARRA